MWKGWRYSKGVVPSCAGASRLQQLSTRRRSRWSRAPERTPPNKLLPGHRKSIVVSRYQIQTALNRIFACDECNSKGTVVVCFLFNIILTLILRNDFSAFLFLWTGLIWYLLSNGAQRGVSSIKFIKTVGYKLLPQLQCTANIIQACWRAENFCWHSLFWIGSSPAPLMPQHVSIIC